MWTVSIQYLRQMKRLWCSYFNVSLRYNAILSTAVSFSSRKAEKLPQSVSSLWLNLLQLFFLCFICGLWFIGLVFQLLSPRLSELEWKLEVEEKKKDWNGIERMGGWESLSWIGRELRREEQGRGESWWKYQRKRHIGIIKLFNKYFKVSR